MAGGRRQRNRAACRFAVCGLHRSRIAAQLVNARYVFVPIAGVLFSRETNCGALS
jgi:hypothetical protein